MNPTTWMRPRERQSSSSELSFLRQLLSSKSLASASSRSNYVLSERLKSTPEVPVATGRSTFSRSKELEKSIGDMAETDRHATSNAQPASQLKRTSRLGQLDTNTEKVAFFHRILWESLVAKTKNDNLQGALALLVLKSLEQGPMHGWGITLHIQRISNEVLRVEEGSLYPALHRMEQDRWIASEWGASENNRRARFYRLTALGRKQLNAERENWQKITSAVALVLDFGKA
jgi:PadR family transcriptional regulator, regulatory protein PadR